MGGKCRRSLKVKTHADAAAVNNKRLQITGLYAPSGIKHIYQTHSQQTFFLFVSHCGIFHSQPSQINAFFKTEINVYCVRDGSENVLLTFTQLLYNITPTARFVLFLYTAVVTKINQKHHIIWVIKLNKCSLNRVH